MEFLIHVVDAKLLIIVARIEIFESKNIQKTNCFGVVKEAGLIKFFGLDCQIHLDNQPIKHIVK